MYRIESDKKDFIDKFVRDNFHKFICYQRTNMEIDNKEKVDYLFKFIIIGDTGVGKSCILNQYLRGKCECPPSFVSYLVHVCS